MKYKEVQMDLFKTDNEYALAHCISQDCAMGAGIAKEFRRRYPKMPNRILEKNPQIGEAISYYGNKRLIFNLITKSKYYHKPTKETFCAAIQSLKLALVNLNIDKLAIPLLGAGLDKLNWDDNREIIQEIFKDTNIEILVCRL